MIYLLCALLGGGVLTAICVPLFRKEHTLESAIIEETEWDLLLRKKEVLLGNIQDLDFEYKCGKLSETDYQQVRKEMTGEVAGVLERIHNIEASLDLDALIRLKLRAGGPQDLIDVVQLVRRHPEVQPKAIAVAEAHGLRGRLEAWLADPRIRSLEEPPPLPPLPTRRATKTSPRAVARGRGRRRASR